MINWRRKIWLKAVSLAVAGVFLFSGVNIPLAQADDGDDCAPRYSWNSSTGFMPAAPAVNFQPVQQAVSVPAAASSSGTTTQFSGGAQNGGITLVVSADGKTGNATYADGSTRTITYASPGGSVVSTVDQHPATCSTPSLAGTIVINTYSSNGLSSTFFLTPNKPIDTISPSDLPVTTLTPAPSPRATPPPCPVPTPMPASTVARGVSDYGTIKTIGMSMTSVGAIMSYAAPIPVVGQAVAIAGVGLAAAGLFFTVAGTIGELSSSGKHVSVSEAMTTIGSTLAAAGKTTAVVSPLVGACIAAFGLGMTVGGTAYGQFCERDTSSLGTGLTNIGYAVIDTASTPGVSKLLSGSGSTYKYVANVIGGGTLAIGTIGNAVTGENVDPTVTALRATSATAAIVLPEIARSTRDVDFARLLEGSSTVMGEIDRAAEAGEPIYQMAGK